MTTSRDNSNEEGETECTKQFAFEHIFGDIYIGQDTMPWTGLSHLYSTAVGFGDNFDAATKLAEAFAKSYCSVE